MVRVLKFAAMFVGVLVSSLALGEEGGAAVASSGNGLWGLGSGLAMGLGAIGGTLGLGIAGASALGGIARNPSSKDQVFTPMLLVLALIEFQAIMAFIIAVLWYAK